MKVMIMEHNERGSTLIIVVWFIAIAGILATFLFYSSQAQQASVVHFEKQQRYTQIAQAVLHEYLGLLVKDDKEFNSPQDDWYAKGRVDVSPKEYEGYEVTLIIEDEGSKPNINTLSEAALGQLLKIVTTELASPSDSPSPTASPTPTEAPPSGSPSAKPEISLDPILDWRDRNSEPRPGGAENTYYQGLNPSYKSRDGCFSSREEIKLVKNGDQLYELLAPELTVFGKVNPNTISGETFCDILHSAGDFFSDSELDTIQEQFEDYRSTRGRFAEVDNVKDLGKITSITLDKFKGLLQIGGSCNVNMATKTSLSVILKDAGYGDAEVNNILSRRKTRAFENVTDTYGLLGYNLRMTTKEKKKPDDFFTTVSTIIRYQIWVRSEKGQDCYYLDVVWQRQKAGVKKEWQVTLLASRELWNKAAPEIPQLEEQTEDEQNKEPSPSP